MSEHGERLRNEARQAFKDAGLTYDVVTPATLRQLRALINQRMKDSGLMLGSFRCRQRGVIHTTPSGRFIEIRCRADYFDDREAVSFNTDGFIGFAGWADSENIVPVVEGFQAWVAEIATASQLPVR